MCGMASDGVMTMKLHNDYEVQLYYNSLAEPDPPSQGESEGLTPRDYNCIDSTAKVMLSYMHC